MSVFSKNAIMKGCVEHYCLACETPLRSEEDAVQHINKPIHRKNLEATSFLDKHRADRVRKVKKGYFCEFCSLFMRTAAKVSPHVAEATHLENKVARRLRREGNGVLAFDNVFIGENAWHGIIDDTCAVCDAEFDNAQIHKTETWHALNLVLIDIETGPDDNIYRKIDESTFQCLTCNTVCALNTMAAHFEDAEHKKLYQHCCDIAKAKFNEENGIPETVKDDKDKKSPEAEVAKVVKEQNAQKPEAEKVVEKEQAKDDKSKKSENESPEKKSRKSPEKEFAKEESKKPVEVEKKEDKKLKVIKEEKPKVSETEKKAEKPGKGAKDGLGKTEKDICKGLGAVNYMATDLIGNQWCILCDWAMDDDAVEVHVKSRHHQTILRMHNERSAKNQTNGPETNGDNPNENKSKILDSAAEFQKNDMKLDMVNGNAYCRKCSKSIDFDFDVINNHIDEHKKKAAKPEAPKDIKPFPTGAEQKSSTSLFTAPVHKNDVKKQEKEKESRASSVASIREEGEVEAKNQTNGPETNVDNPNENKSKILDSAAEFQKNDMKLDMVNGNAYCRKCSKSIDFDFDVINNHIDEHKKKAAKPEAPKDIKPFPTGAEQKSSTSLFTAPVHKNDVKKQEKEKESRASSVASIREEGEVEAFAKQHNLTYNKGKNNAFCRLCVTKVPAAIKNMKEHVNGNSHKSKIAKTTVNKTVSNPAMRPSHVFIDSVITIENMFSKDIVINEKYALNILSFLMITKTGSKLRCQACEVNLAVSEIDSHKNTGKHEKAMNEVSVVTSQETEFIREIRPNLFHCGYCNQLEATWTTMDSHLKSTAHREAKTAASWRMVEYTPMIAQHKARQRMQLEVFTRMVMGQMFGYDD